MEGFSQNIRVYYENTDAGGVVYHADYLKFFERTRTDWLRALGVEQDQLREQHDVIFAVSRMSIDYRHPARFNDLLTVDCKVKRLRRASIELDQTILSQQDQLLCSAEVLVACVNSLSFKPSLIPDSISRLLKSADDR